MSKGHAGFAIKEGVINYDGRRSTARTAPQHAATKQVAIEVYELRVLRVSTY